MNTEDIRQFAKELRGHRTPDEITRSIIANIFDPEGYRAHYVKYWLADILKECARIHGTAVGKEIAEAMKNK